MDPQTHDTDGRLIDRFLHHQLSGAELRDFHARCENDSAFKTRLEFRRMVVHGARMSSDSRLESEITAMLSYRKSRVPFGLKVLTVFLLVVVGGLLFWNYLGNDPGKSTKILDLRKIVRRATESVTGNRHDTVYITNVLPADTDSVVVSEIDSSLTFESENAEFESLATANGHEDIVVVKDQLLSGTRIIVKKADVEDKQRSLAQESARQLNPDAGLPEENDGFDAYEVEFWVNPVNYKGYRLVGDRLVLFGIEQPESCRLFQLRGQLYLVSSGEVVEISPTAELRPYRPVKDPEIIKSIK